MSAPLVPAEVDLRDFPYMPLDVGRLRDSDLTGIATGDEFRAAVVLWCAAWHQVPAASLPDDDRVLARLAGFGRDVDAWHVVRDVALRGFVTCNDGRLYHPVIAEKAIDAWEAKASQRARTAAATAARRASRVSQGAERKAKKQLDRDGERDVGRDVGRHVHQERCIVEEIPTTTTQEAREEDRISDPELECLLFEAVEQGGGRVRRANAPALMNLAPIRGLIDAGYDLRTEILATIRARARGKEIGSWSYFVEAVHQSRVTRLEAARPRAGPRAPPNLTSNPALAACLEIIAE